MDKRAFYAVKDYSGEQKSEIHEYQGATVRCYKCHSTKVTSVCHHCGRLLCAAHEVRPKLYQDPSREFVPLMQPPSHKGAHCADHAHHTFSPLKAMTLPGLVIAVIGGLWVMARIAAMVDMVNYFIWLTKQEPLLQAVQHVVTNLAVNSTILSISLVVLILGVILAVFGIQAYLLTRARSEKVELAAAPLIAKQHIIRIEEDIKLKLKIQEGDEPYLDVLSRKGAISTQISLDENAVEMQKAYRAKCKKYGWTPKEALDMGYLAVQRPEWITWPEASGALGPAGDHFHLVAQGINVEELAESGAWREFLRIEYEIGPDALNTRDETQPPRFIFWLRPVIEPMSGGRILRFEFDVAEPDVAGSAAKTATLKSFILKIDPGAFADGDAALPIVGTNGHLHNERGEVQWLELPLQPGNHSIIPDVTFRRPVSEMKQPLTATFELRFDSTVSGLALQQAHIWLPTGRPLADQGGTTIVRQSTRLTGEAFIEPSVFSYQYEFTAPAHPIECDGIMLTDEIVEAVIKALEKDQVYVKRVVEDAPVVALKEGALRKHKWDILGRYYAHIYPIDVHVTLAGQESLDASDPSLSKVSGEISLRALINSQAHDMEQVVKAKCGDLHATLGEVLQGSAGI
jgi:hypothetical protein